MLFGFKIDRSPAPLNRRRDYRSSFRCRIAFHAASCSYLQPASPAEPARAFLGKLQNAACPIGSTGAPMYYTGTPVVTP